MPPALTADTAHEEVTALERLAGVNASVDAATGIIRGVKVIGFTSQNGRSYPPDVLRRSVQLYEGAKVFFDHENDGSKDGNTTRKYKDRFGSLKNARFVEGKGIYADHYFNPKHPAAEQYVWDAQHAPDAVGFSHTALLRFSKQPDAQGRRVVEEINRVLSVDLVAEPATTKGLFESADPPRDDAAFLQELTVERLRTARPDLIESLTESATSDRIRELEQQLAEQQQVIDRLTAETAISEEFRAAGLDPANPEHVSAEFREYVAAIADCQVRREVIDDRAALLRSIESTGHEGDIATESLPSKPVTSPTPWSAPEPSALARRIREAKNDPAKFAALCS